MQILEPFVPLLFFHRQDLIMYTSWLQTYRDLPAPASQVLELKAKARILAQIEGQPGLHSKFYASLG